MSGKTEAPGPGGGTEAAINIADAKYTRPNIWWPMYPADWAIDTRHLSLEIRGAYLELLNSYWRNGKVLPNNDAKLGAILGVSLRTFRRLRLDLEPLFTVTPEAWAHPFLEAELARARHNSEKRREAARARWNKEREANANGYANASGDSMQMQCPSPSPSPKTNCLGINRVPPPDGAQVGSCSDLPKVEGGLA